MILNIPAIMVRCLLFTIFMESIVALIIGIRHQKDFLNIVLVNCITNPLVVTVPLYCNLQYGIEERRIALLILEILTVIVEGLVYQKFLKFKKMNPYGISFVLNLCSYLIGEVMNYILY